jgi:hypothetical protein
VQPNETLQLTNEGSTEAIAVAAYVDAGASAVVMPHVELTARS